MFPLSRPLICRNTLVIFSPWHYVFFRTWAEWDKRGCLGARFLFAFPVQLQAILRPAVNALGGRFRARGGHRLFGVRHNFNTML